MKRMGQSLLIKVLIILPTAMMLSLVQCAPILYSGSNNPFASNDDNKVGSSGVINTSMSEARDIIKRVEAVSNNTGKNVENAAASTTQLPLKHIVGGGSAGAPVTSTSTAATTTTTATMTTTAIAAKQAAAAAAAAAATPAPTVVNKTDLGNGNYDLELSNGKHTSITIENWNKIQAQAADSAQQQVAQYLFDDALRNVWKDDMDGAKDRFINDKKDEYMAEAIAYSDAHPGSYDIYQATSSIADDGSTVWNKQLVETVLAPKDFNIDSYMAANYANNVYISHGELTGQTDLKAYVDNKVSENQAEIDSGANAYAVSDEAKQHASDAVIGYIASDESGYGFGEEAAKVYGTVYSQTLSDAWNGEDFRQYVIPSLDAVTVNNIASGYANDVATKAADGAVYGSMDWYGMSETSGLTAAKNKLSTAQDAFDSASANLIDVAYLDNDPNVDPTVSSAIIKSQNDLAAATDALSAAKADVAAATLVYNDMVNDATSGWQAAYDAVYYGAHDSATSQLDSFLRGTTTTLSGGVRDYVLTSIDTTSFSATAESIASEKASQAVKSALDKYASAIISNKSSDYISTQVDAVVKAYEQNQLSTIIPGVVATLEAQQQKVVDSMNRAALALDSALAQESAKALAQDSVKALVSYGAVINPMTPNSVQPNALAQAKLTDSPLSLPAIEAVDNSRIGMPREMDNSMLMNAFNAAAPEISTIAAESIFTGDNAGKIDASMMLADIVNAPTPEQKEIMSAAMALMAEMDRLQAEGADPAKIAEMKDDAAKAVAAALLAQAIPDLLKEGDTAVLRDSFAKLNVEKNKLLGAYQEAVKPYYDEVRKDIASNMETLQSFNILSNGLSKKEVDALPPSEIEKIMEKLRQAKTRNANTEYIIQQEAKYRKKYLDPNRDKLQMAMKDLLKGFSSRVTEIITDAGAAKKAADIARAKANKTTSPTG